MHGFVCEFIGMGAKKYGGFEKFIVEECRQLKDRNYKLIVIFDREPVADLYVEDLLRLGAIIRVIPYKGKTVFIRDILGLFKEFHPQVVHTNFSSNVFLVLSLAKIFRVKRLIASEHCLPAYRGFKNKLVAQTICCLADNVLPVSEKSSENFKRATWFNHSRIKTSYLGVDDVTYNKEEVRRELMIDKDILLLMNIAYHNPVKGVDVLIEAMNIIVNDYNITNIILFQIGGGQTGEDTNQLKALVHKYRLESYITWLGIRNDVPRLLAAGDIYIQPSRSEGIGLSIMEASIASLPVVATNIGGIPEVAIDGVNAILTEINDARLLADAIMNLCNDASKRKSFGERGRENALHRFCLRNNVTRMIDNFYQL